MLGSATGFFYTLQDDVSELFLVANRHVVIDEAKGFFPRKLLVRLHTDAGFDKVFYPKASPARPVVLGVQVDPSDLAWDMFPDASAYDAVFGSLNILRETGGDFTAATAGCLGSDVASPPVGGTPDPPAGEAFWYLVRADGGVAGTTYDAGDPGQGGACDAQINAAPVTCA